MSAFDRAFDFTLAREGGYVNNKADHGGPTNHGITQATYDAYRAARGLDARDVHVITDGEVQDCYRRNYWLPAHCDIMSSALGTCMFDWAVNHGVEGATRTLQRACGITDDGVFGQHTRSAVLSLDHDDLWRQFNTLRREWYREDVVRDPSQAQFLEGWLYRVDRLDAFCETLENGT